MPRAERDHRTGGLAPVIATTTQGGPIGTPGDGQVYLMSRMVNGYRNGRPFAALAAATMLKIHATAHSTPPMPSVTIVTISRLSWKLSASIACAREKLGPSFAVAITMTSGPTTQVTAPSR